MVSSPYVAIENIGLPGVKESRIVLVAFEGSEALDLLGPLEVFARANRYSPQLGEIPLRYAVTLGSVDGGEVTTSSGLTIGKTVAFQHVGGPIDTILVSGGSPEGIRRARSDSRLQHWLFAEARRARRLEGVSTGAFLVLAAGAAESDRGAEGEQTNGTLQSGFRLVEPVSDSVGPEEDGSSAPPSMCRGIDVALAMVEEDVGEAVAAAVARDLMLLLPGAASQPLYSGRVSARPGSGGRLGKLLVWIADNPDADLTLAALAERAAMSERNFERIFAHETGTTLALYVRSMRARRAKLYLETTDWPVQRVAERSGFGSYRTFLRAFTDEFGTTPDAYCRRLRAAAEDQGQSASGQEARGGPDRN